MEFEISEAENEGSEITKELVLKALRISLSENNLINRLFKEQLESDIPFPEAEGIIWDLQPKGNGLYWMITSEKWLSKDDFTNLEYECNVIPSIGKLEEE